MRDFWHAHNFLENAIDYCLTVFIRAVLYIYLWYQVYLFSRQLYLDGRTSLEDILQSGPVAV